VIIRFWILKFQWFPPPLYWKLVMPGSGIAQNPGKSCISEYFPPQGPPSDPFSVPLSNKGFSLTGLRWFPSQKFSLQKASVPNSFLFSPPRIRTVLFGFGPLSFGQALSRSQYFFPISDRFILFPHCDQ